MPWVRRRAIGWLSLAIAALVLLVAVLFAHFARADDIRPPLLDCAFVRAKVAEHGKLAAYAWAVANGYSVKEIARIRKVCGV